ncbi:MAG: sulfide/dihydroorotate dehydrogenase-like FAD/NAD-binding protein [Thermoplasmata archaeon]|nr:sulfide/dihydroorotate dehydrogenase-like FAD/NAD-binding protein [Thermoplasmata archaeon]
MSGDYRIVEKHEVVPNVHKLVIRDPRIARRARPGQFVLLMSSEKGERIPFTLSDWDVEKGTITLYVLELGISTMKLVGLRKGDSLFSLAGPLGQPAIIKKFGTVVLGGGCFGIGGIYPIAKALKAAGNHVVAIIEARSNYLLFNRENLRSAADEFYVTTSDGSEGMKGHVQDRLIALVEEGKKFDRAYFMGCTFMLMECAEATRPYSIPTGVALNAIMVDGTGMCGCCRVTVDGHMRFVCVDGPEMDGHKVDWEELFTRKRVYREEEAVAYQSHVCRALSGYEMREGGEE